MTEIDPIDNESNYKFGLFYYNPDDPRTIVPKRLRVLGFTMNFAKPLSYFVLILLVIWLIFLGSTI